MPLTEGVLFAEEVPAAAVDLARLADAEFHLLEVTGVAEDVGEIER